MKKGVVHSTSDELYNKCEKRVTIHRDRWPPNPLKEYDQVFYFHSNIDRELCGNESDNDYPDPLVEIEDEDGYGTGEYKVKDGIVAFWVSAYIHGGIALHMGTVRCAFGDSMGPGGRGWDTTPNAAFMWTNKERFEKMCGPWMEIYDEKTKTRRPAKDEKEFTDYLYDLAKGELELFQKYIDGECYWYGTEVKRRYHKKYDTGEEVDGFDWEDGEDSCGGYYIDNVGDIDFPKEDGWEVFADDDCSNLVGDEFDIPEYVVVNKHFVNHVGETFFLKGYTKDSEGKVVSTSWTNNIDEALVFTRWFGIQHVAQDVIDKEFYKCEECCIEKDELKAKKEAA